MVKYSVLEDDPPSLDELVAMGPTALGDLFQEAYRLLANQTRTYGLGYRPGNQRFIEFCLKRDIEMITTALKTIDQRGKSIETNPASSVIDEPSPMFREKWPECDEPGKRARRELVLKTEDSSPAKKAWQVTYSSEPYEGRHMRLVYSQCFDSYDDAITHLIELAKKYAPEYVINRAKKLTRLCTTLRNSVLCVMLVMVSHSILHIRTSTQGKALL